MEKDKFVIIAKILKPHGVTGAIKIKSFAQNPQDIFNMNLYNNSGEKLLLKLLHKKGDFFISKIDSINNMDDANSISGNYIYANVEEFNSLEEDEFYIYELIGRAVYDMNKVQIGIVHQVHNFGAGDLLEIKFNTGESEILCFDIDNFPIVNDKEIVINHIKAKLSHDNI